MDIGGGFCVVCCGLGGGMTFMYFFCFCFCTVYGLSGIASAHRDKEHIVLLVALIKG